MTEITFIVSFEDLAPDFSTHLNYVCCLNTISNGLKFQYNKNIREVINKSKYVQSKTTLVNITKRSLDSEYSTMQDNIEFAVVCVPWISVKAYYLIFTLYSLLFYLTDATEYYFTVSHKEFWKRLKDKLSNEELEFSVPDLNKCYDSATILSRKQSPGNNIRIRNVNNQNRCFQILKKLLIYKVEELQRQEKLKDFRSKKSKEIRDNYLAREKNNLCEFFYWYRIKANYRDMQFLDKKLSDEQFFSYYKNYYELTMNFYNAGVSLVNKLSQIRIGHRLFK